MAREFIVSLGSSTVTSGSTTLVFLNPPAAPNFNIAILRMWIGQAANATSAQQRVQLNSQITQFPTLVAATPAKVKRADPNVSVLVGSTTGAAATAGVGATSEGTGTKTQIADDTFNVLNGWLSVPTPDEIIVMPAGSTSGFGMSFPALGGSTTGWSYGVTFAER